MVNPYAYAQPPQRQIESVTGRQSAEAYQLAPNSSAILLDSTRDRFYVVRSDASGYRTVDAYDFVKAEDEGAQREREMQELQSQISEIKRDIEELKGALQ